jgi:hypothetical protein
MTFLYKQALPGLSAGAWEEAAKDIGSAAGRAGHAAAAGAGEVARETARNPGLIRRGLGAIGGELNSGFRRGIAPAGIGYMADEFGNEETGQDWLANHMGGYGLLARDLAQQKANSGFAGKYGFTLAGLLGPNAAHYVGRTGYNLARDEAGNLVKRPGTWGRTARGVGTAGGEWLEHPGVGVLSFAGINSLSNAANRREGEITGGRNVLHNIMTPGDPTNRAFVNSVLNPNSKDFPRFLESLKYYPDLYSKFQTALGQQNENWQNWITQHPELLRSPPTAAGTNPGTNPAGTESDDTLDQPNTGDTVGRGFGETVAGMPNWAKALGMGGAALGGGYLLNRMTGNEKRKQSRMPGWGTLAGLGGVGVGLGALTNWDYSKLGNPSWWGGKTASALSTHTYIKRAEDGQYIEPEWPMPARTGVGPWDWHSRGENFWYRPATPIDLGGVGYAERQARPQRIAAWRKGDQVHLTEGDLSDLTNAEIRQVANDPRQITHQRYEGPIMQGKPLGQNLRGWRLPVPASGKDSIGQIALKPSQATGIGASKDNPGGDIAGEGKDSRLNRDEPILRRYENAVYSNIQLPNKPSAAREQATFLLKDPRNLPVEQAPTPVKTPTTEPPPPSPSTPSPTGTIPNWGKALGVAGVTLGGGYLLNKLMPKRKEEEHAGRSYMPRMGTLAGLGGLGVGLGSLTNWDYKKLINPQWWGAKTASTRRVPLSMYKYAAPNFFDPANLTSGLNKGLNSIGMSGLANTTNQIGGLLGNRSPLTPPPLGVRPDSPPNLQGPNLGLGAAIGGLGAAPAESAMRIGPWSQGQQVHLQPQDLNYLNPSQTNQLANDPRQQQYIRTEGFGAGHGGPTAPGLFSRTPPPATGKTGPTGDAVAATGQAQPATPPPTAGVSKGGPEAQGLFGQTPQPGEAKDTALTNHIIQTHFNGDPNAAQQAAWQRLQEQVPPEVQAQGPQGIMGWMSAMWGKLSLTEKVLLGVGLGLGAIGLMGMMRGGGANGEGGMGMAGPLLGIGGLGLAGYLGYQGFDRARGQSTGDASGGLDPFQAGIGNPVTPENMPLPTRPKIDDLLTRAAWLNSHGHPDAETNLQAHFARHDPAMQSHIRNLYADNPERLQAINHLYSDATNARGNSLGVNGPPTGGQPNAPPGMSDDQVAAEGKHLATSIPGGNQFFDPKTGKPNYLGLLGAFSTNPNSLAPVIQGMSPELKKHTLDVLKETGPNFLNPQELQTARQLLAQPSSGGGGTANPNEPAAPAAGQSNFKTDEDADNFLKTVIGDSKYRDTVADQLQNPRASVGLPPKVLQDASAGYLSDEDFNRLSSRIDAAQQALKDRTDFPGVVDRKILDQARDSLLRGRTQYAWRGMGEPTGYSEFWKSPKNVRDYALTRARYLMKDEVPADFDERVKETWAAKGGQGEPTPKFVNAMKEDFGLQLMQDYAVRGAGKGEWLNNLLGQEQAYKGLEGLPKTYQDRLQAANQAYQNADAAIKNEPQLNSLLQQRATQPTESSIFNPQQWITQASQPVEQAAPQQIHQSYRDLLTQRENADTTRKVLDYMVNNRLKDPNFAFNGDPYQLDPEHAQQLYQNVGPEYADKWIAALRARAETQQALENAQNMQRLFPQNNYMDQGLENMRRTLQERENALRGYPTLP